VLLGNRRHAQLRHGGALRDGAVGLDIGIDQQALALQRARRMAVASARNAITCMACKFSRPILASGLPGRTRIGR